MRGGEDEEGGRCCCARRTWRPRAGDAEVGDGLLAFVQHSELAQAEHSTSRACTSTTVDRRMPCARNARLDELVDMSEGDDRTIRQSYDDMSEPWCESDGGDGVRS